MVRRLVRRGVLRPVGGAESARRSLRHAARQPRRGVASRRPVEPGRPPLFLAATPALLRLRREIRARRGGTAEALQYPDHDGARAAVDPEGRGRGRLDWGGGCCPLVPPLPHLGGATAPSPAASWGHGLSWTRQPD